MLSVLILEDRADDYTIDPSHSEQDQESTYSPAPELCGGK